VDARALIAFVVAVVVAAACSPESASRRRDDRRDLVIVAIDALRLDRTGLAGDGSGAPSATPHLDELARSSLTFTRARAASSYTLQSVAALFTGRLPTSGGAIGLLEAQPSERALTLAAAFRRAGYRTTLATNQPLLSGRGFTRGFDDVAVATAETLWPCAEVVQRGLAAMTAADARPRLVYLQLVEPHEPHAPSYEAEIAAADTCLGTLVDGLEERDALDRTVLVVVGTQGEEVGEHGDHGSGWTLYDEVLRVPLLVRAPGLLEPARNGVPASIVDLYPTLLTLHAIAPPEGEDALLDGRSLLAARGGGFRPIEAGERTVLAELVIPERAIVRAVIEGDLKYVASVKAHAPAERDEVAAAYFDVVAAVAKGEAEAQRLWAAPQREELYDLAADPAEMHDLAGLTRSTGDGAGVHEAAIERLRAVLARYEQHCREHGLAARQARPRTALPTAEEIEKLKSLSYL
jgi:arylsulfatase A-like enzyme